MLHSKITPKRLLFVFGICVFFLASWDLPMLSQNSEIEDIDKREKTYKGSATYYHNKYHGRKTASGERYSKKKYTAAVRMNKIKVPFGTILEVTNLENNKTVRVKVNDKMPKKSSAIIDLSRKAAKDLDMIKAGRIKVEIRVVSE